MKMQFATQQVERKLLTPPYPTDLFPQTLFDFDSIFYIQTKDFVFLFGAKNDQIYHYVKNRKTKKVKDQWIERKKLLPWIFQTISLENDKEILHFTKDYFENFEYNMWNDVYDWLHQHLHFTSITSIFLFQIPKQQKNFSFYLDT